MPAHATLYDGACYMYIYVYVCVFVCYGGAVESALALRQFSTRQRIINEMRYVQMQ